MDEFERRRAEESESLLRRKDEWKEAVHEFRDADDRLVAVMLADVMRDSLSAVYSFVARRAGLRTALLPLPHHVMLRLFAGEPAPDAAQSGRQDDRSGRSPP